MTISILDREFRNNAAVGISSGISDAATSVTVDDGSVINLTAGKHMIATLLEGSAMEIILITSQTGATLTIERAQEGTIAQAFTAAATLEIRPTAGSLSGILDYLISLLPAPPAFPVWGDITLFSYDSISNDVTASVGANGWSLKFSTDGFHMYIIDAAWSLVQRFTLSTAWDITTAAAADTLSAGGDSGGSVCFSNDGTKAYYLIQGSTTNIKQYALSTPWVLASASYVAQSPDMSYPVLNNPTDMVMSLDGTKMLICSEGAKKLLAFSLSTAFDVSTLSTTPTGELFPNHVGFYFVAANEDFSKILWTAQNTSPSPGIEQYSVSTPGDLSTATLLNRQPTSSPITNHNGIFVGPTKIYFLSSGVVYQFSW
jgi:hypothetical protein